MDECIHGLGPVEACVICNGRAKREAAELVVHALVMPGTTDGQCNECNLPIHVGQVVAWLPEHRTTHASCWPPAGSDLRA